MCEFLQRLTGGYKSKAIIAGDKLILSFPDAVTPVMWHMEFKSLSQSAIELEVGKDGVFSLVSKQGSKAKQIIAKFESRAKAIRALMQTTKALENGIRQTQTMHTAQTPATPIVMPKPSILGSIFRSFFTIIGTVLLVGLFIAGIAFFVFGGSITTSNQAVVPQASSTQPSGPTGGVPFSAEDFLKNK